MVRQQHPGSFRHEETLFNLQFSIVLVEHLRLISHAVRKRHAITLSEYCTLLLLDALEGEVNGTALAHYLDFRPGTMLAILSSLEDREFVKKGINPHDKRAMFVCLTVSGHKLARLLAHEVDILMSTTFWRSFPPSEYLAPLKELEALLDGLRGYTMDDLNPLWDTKGLTHAVLFRTIQLVVDQWTSAVRQCSGLTFNEGRILLLLELYGSLKPCEIAGRLHLARSNVSLGLNLLVERKLLKSIPTPGDNRSKLYRGTARGLSLSRELHFVLQKATYDVYKVCSSEAIIALNAQHMRMYSDLYYGQHTIETIFSI